MARGVLQLLGAACLALASGARAQASCDVTDFVLPSNVGIDSCDGLVCTTDATAGTTTCSGTVAHAATCTLKCAPPGAFDCQRGDACTRIDSDDIRTAGPPDAYDLDGDGVADLLDADTYPNAVRGVEHPWLLSGGDTPLQAVVSLNARDGGLVQPSCTDGVFDAGSVACTSCPTVEHAQWYGCGYRQNPDTSAWNWLTEGASCSMGSYMSDEGEFAVSSQACSLCDEVENAKIREIWEVPWGCPRCIYQTSCTVAGRTQVVHCADGYFKTDMSNSQTSDTCTACTPVEDATSITCTETGNSRATCAPGMFKTDNSATTPSQSDTCTACTPVPGATSIECDGTGNTRAQCEDGLVHVGNNDAGTSDMCCTAVEGAASVTCTAVGNSRATCDQGRYVTDNGADGTSDTCTPCAWVEGADSVTCTGPDSRATCAANFGLTDNSEQGISDVCHQCGGQWDNPDPHAPPNLPGTYFDSGRCTPCTEVQNAVRVSCSEGGQSSVDECSAGYFKDHTGDGGCVACQPVENALTVECENRFESDALTCEEGFTLENNRCGTDDDDDDDDDADGPPPPPPPPPPPATKVIATLTLAGDVETVAGAEGSTERATFETAFKDDVATTIGVSVDQIAIVSITAASVEVVFEVLPTSSGESVEASAVQTAFSDVVALPTVGVSTTGSITTTVETVQDEDIDLSDKSSVATCPSPLVGGTMLAALAVAASLAPL